MNKKFYVTTPIYYANGSPHIGHFLTTTVADALARYHRILLKEENVFFTTGLDEHGTSVEKAAISEGYTLENIKAYVDKRAEEWKQAFDETEISYDYFVRTTNPTHEQFAKDFIQKMVDKGDVYKATYKGKYCNGCEKFLTLSDLNEEGFCPLHRPDQIIDVEEENYFFKLSKYAPVVGELIEKDEIKIVPDGKKHEMIARIKAGVEDLSISRPKKKVGWGVDFPNDENQVIYVWVEALINYLSSLEINNKKDFWEHAVHLLAKDINWFHTVIWPSFLLSAEYALPKNEFVHSYLNIAGQKISKSLGNIITPEDLKSRYGIDGAKYLIVSNIPYKNDVDITWELLDERYNAHLANGLGNLTARLTKLAENSGLGFKLKEIDKKELFEQEWVTPMQEFKIDIVLQNIWVRIGQLDKHINEKEPWKIEDKAELQKILDFELNELLEISLMIEPFLPNTSEKISKQLTESSKIPALKGLFPRI